jgi:hypothetical protein
MVLSAEILIELRLGVPCMWLPQQFMLILKLCATGINKYLKSKCGIFLPDILRKFDEKPWAFDKDILSCA